MKCPKCKTEMYIETWEAWVWKCPMCDYNGRISTQEESDLQEKAEAHYQAKERIKDGGTTA